MASTAQEIADEVLAAHEESLEAGAHVLGSRFAEKVAVVSDSDREIPGVANDSGPGTFLPGAVLRKGRLEEIAAFRQALPDFHEDVDVEVDGDDLTVTYTVTGTLPDGTKVDAAVPAVYTVKDGEIVQVGLSYPEGAIEALMKVFAVAGWRPTME